LQLGRIVVAMLLVAASLLATAGTRAASAEVPMAPPKIPANGQLFGASIEGSATVSFPAQMAALESQLGRTLAIDRVFTRWDDTQPSQMTLDDFAEGRVPLLSISSQRRDGSKLQWAQIAAGTYDADIRRQADALRDTGRPIILAFQHEPEMLTGYGTAADFRAAFQRFVTVFRGEGATNIAFAMILTPAAYLDAASWYPGAGYVDWLGADAYNFASCTTGVSGWRSLKAAAQPFYDWAVTTGKPLMLAEWGSAVDPADPNRRTQWMQDAAVTLASWPEIKATSYFNRVGTCDWRIGDTGPTADAFKSLATSANSNGRPTAGLVPSSTVGPAPFTTTLSMTRSTGGESVTGTGVSRWTLDFGDGSPVISGAGQPTAVAHTYPAGTWTAKVTVTDAGGRIASGTATMISAAPPVVGQNDPTSKTSVSATVPGWIHTNSLVGTYYVEWGTTVAYTQRSATGALAALSYSKSVSTMMTGLTQGVTYHWRTVATTAAGTVKANDRTFTL
jgi:hypothetical protein